MLTVCPESFVTVHCIVLLTYNRRGKKSLALWSLACWWNNISHENSNFDKQLTTRMPSNSGLIIHCKPCCLHLPQNVASFVEVFGSVSSRFTAIKPQSYVQDREHAGDAQQSGSLSCCVGTQQFLHTELVSLSNCISREDVNVQRLRQTSKRVNRKSQPSWNIRENCLKP